MQMNSREGFVRERQSERERKARGERKRQELVNSEKESYCLPKNQQQKCFV